MPEQHSLLENHKSLQLLPSAKVKQQDKVGVHSWTKFYASFPESFVDYTIEAMQMGSNDTLLDPFVGVKLHPKLSH